MKFLRLSLRDFFWLTLLAAVAFGWYADRRQTAAGLRPDWQPAFITVGSRARDFYDVDSDLRTLELMRLATLSDAELIAAFREEAWVDEQLESTLSDVWLTELVRRKLPQPLREAYGRILRAQSFPYRKADWKIAVLTALRRAEGKPDPLRIELKIQRTNQRGEPDRFARIALRFVDENGQEMKDLEPYQEFQEGRDQRWRVELLDEDGELVSEANPPTGYSSYAPNPLGHDPTRLDPRKYVAPPKSGRYRLRLIFCRHPIAKYPRTDGLLMWESQPIEVTVQRGFRLPQMYLAATVTAALGLSLLIAICRAQLRETVFLALITAIACGWTLDQYRLARRIYNEIPHSQADWTMKQRDDRFPTLDESRP